MRCERAGRGAARSGAAAKEQVDEERRADETPAMAGATKAFMVEVQLEAVLMVGCSRGGVARLLEQWM